MSGDLWVIVWDVARTGRWAARGCGRGARAGIV